MRKLIALLLVLVFIAAAGCASKPSNSSNDYNRAIQRSNEGHRDLDANTK